MKPNSLARIVRRLAAGLAVLAFAGASQAVVVAADSSSFGGTTVITFDEPGLGWVLKDQFVGLGIVDFDAAVLGSHGNAMTLPYEMFGLSGAVSGQQVGLMGATIEFAAGIDRVGVWLYKGNGAQYLTALDAQQNVLLSLGADAGSGDSPYYDFVGMQSDARDIRFVVISNKDLAADSRWSTSGHAAFYDNLMFSPIAAVPEPQTWVLMLLCLALMGVIVRRRR
jgi:hypothetical protein